MISIYTYIMGPGRKRQDIRAELGITLTPKHCKGLMGVEEKMVHKGLLKMVW